MLIKTIVFVLHFFFFGLTGVFFLLKFHKKKKLKFVILATMILWLVFGTIDFVLELNRVISTFV